MEKDENVLQALPVIPPIGARGAEERRREEGNGSSESGTFSQNQLAKLGDAIAISNLKLSMTDPLTH